MKRYLTTCVAGIMLATSSLVFADTDSKEEVIEAAEKGCLDSAQERYGVSAEDVQLRGSAVKWNSGLKGYKVDLIVKDSTGRDDNYVCVAKKDGSYKFYSG